MSIKLKNLLLIILRSTLLMLLVMGLNLSLFCYSASANLPVSVEQAPNGFIVSLPAAAIDESRFDQLGNVEIKLNLSDPTLGYSSVNGVGVRTFKNRLFIRTNDLLDYLPTSQTFITLTRPEVTGFPPCLDTDLPPILGACTITYCPSTIVCRGSLNCRCLD